jgi:hypothetical protein
VTAGYAAASVMKRLVQLSCVSLLALAALSGVGCGHKGSPRLEGHWRGLSADGVATDVQASADLFATGTELDIRGENIVVSTPKGKQSGKFRVKTDEKNQITIWTDGDGPNDPQTFTFVDERTMKWSVLEGKTIIFRRETTAIP